MCTGFTKLTKGKYSDFKHDLFHTIFSFQFNDAVLYFTYSLV